jgi:AraC family transcriptional regulator
MAMTHNLGAAGDRRFRNLAPAPVPGPVVHRLHRGETVTVYEWRCGGEDHGSPREEWSDAYEVIVPRRGTFIFQIEGRQIFADRSRAAFLRPGETYRVRHPLPGGDAGSVFRLEASAGGALLDELSQGHFLARSMALDGRGYWLHQKAVRALRDPAASKLELEELAVDFVRKAGSQAGQRPGPADRIAEEYAQRVQEFIAARYREPLTLAQVARAVDASPFHLSRLVKAATGLPIHRMIVRLRLRDALEQLLETRESIAFIALATGFASHSHLTDAFTKEYGMPPSAVRAQRSRRGSPRARP